MTRAALRDAPAAGAQSAPTHIDSRYYEVAPPRSLAERLVIHARDRIYDDFIRLCRPRPEETILDVGVSDVIGDAANVLERRCPHPERLTAAGLGTAEDFRIAFPQVAYRQAWNCRRKPIGERPRPCSR